MVLTEYDAYVDTIDEIENRIVDDSKFPSQRQQNQKVLSDNFGNCENLLKVSKDEYSQCHERKRIKITKMLR